MGFPFNINIALNSPRLRRRKRTKTWSPFPPVPQEQSSSDANSAVIPTSLLIPKGMLKRRGAAEYNPACWGAEDRIARLSTSCFSCALLSSSSWQVRRAAVHPLTQCEGGGRLMKTMLSHRLSFHKWWKGKGGGAFRRLLRVRIEDRLPD